MGIDPDTPAPSKYGDFATRARTEPAEPPKERKSPKGGKPPKEGELSRRPSRRLLLGLVVAVVVGAGAAFFVVKPGDDTSSGNRALPGTGATGILAEVKGSTLTVRTGSGASVKVSTSQSTAVTKAVPGSLADINVGDNVMVTGISTAPDAFRAERVVNSGTLSAGPGPFGGPVDAGTGMPPERGGGLASGKVQSVTGSGFVLSGAGAPPVTVSVDGTTVVAMIKTAAVKDLAVGHPIVVSGTSKDDGTLVATSVQQDVSGLDTGPRPGRDGMAGTTN